MSFYGTDNAYLLQAIENHLGLFSGIAVVNERSPAIESELINLHSRGVRGFRIQCDSDGGNLQTKSMKRLWRLAAERRMAISPFIGPEAIPALDRMCADHPETLVVVDHGLLEFPIDV